ncbi:hypothetical protein NPIL_290581 [Nephila pilipes]|uniref:Uncharacterized protein n=1 Tax=Nephila pilipes TaxID=299642 RepID=A0A8X6QST2_NEPPI|nr:hypothetical protein NPIL_290581 [Nephila pilipes]
MVNNEHQTPSECCIPPASCRKGRRQVDVARHLNVNRNVIKELRGRYQRDQTLLIRNDFERPRINLQQTTVLRVEVRGGS